jgi:CarD family transcriptional regulator
MFALVDRRMNMFEINDYIIYGENGVCTIADISTPPMAGFDKNSKYYILHPVRSAGRTIYTPVDNTKVTMRKILTREEALALIHRMPNIDVLWVSSDKLREEYYKKAIRSNCCEEWIKIIKTSYQRKEERKAEGKSVSATDDKYFKLAEMYLYDELSIALGIPAEQIKDYLFDKVRELETVKVLGYEEFETK